MPNEDNATHKDEHQGNIIIDLDDLEHSDSYEADELLFNKECKKWGEKIRKSLADNIGERNSTPQKKKHVHQQTYYIGGGRGSGKSTFLHAIINRLVKKETEDSGNDLAIRKIAIIDPTKLGAGEDFFIHILSCFSSIIHNNNDPADDTQLYKQKQITDRREIMQCIQTIVEGVKNIANKNRSTLDSIDDAWFIQNSMQNSASSSHLREQFGGLILLTCQYLSCDALIIGIDDADINSTKSREVLEYMRKYMLNSRLIFMFAGDIPLQEQMVRCMQLENFSEKALKYDVKEENVRLHLISQMQEQYMLKLFPIANRYNIPNLTKGLLKNIKLMYRGIVMEDSCYDFAKKMLKEHVGDAETMMRALLQMPKRTFFQLMQSWCSGDEIANGLRQIATYSIAKYCIKDLEIESNSVRALSHGVISAVSQDEDMITKAALYPTEEDELNRAYLYLSSEVCRNTLHCAQKLEYLLMTFPYLQILSMLREVVAKEDPIRERRDETELYFNRYLSNSLDGDYKLWCRRITACLAVIPKNGTNTSKVKQYALGCIRVMQRNDKSKWSRLTSVEKQILSSTKTPSTEKAEAATLFYLSFKNSISGISIGAKKALCVSVYNLLGTVMQCIATLVGGHEDKQDILIKKIGSIIAPTKEYLVEGRPYSQDYRQEEENDDAEALSTEHDDITSNMEIEYPADIDNESIEFAAKKIVDWWSSNSKNNFKTYACDYSLCWKSYISRTIWKTGDIALKQSTKTNAHTHYVANTMTVYMDAFISSIQNYIGFDFAKFISDFPLWIPWNTQSHDASLYEEFRNLVNGLYAGQPGDCMFYEKANTAISRKKPKNSTNRKSKS